jgi:NADP-dependent 3-hydroxy acid dehydrogenase YdfG
LTKVGVNGFTESLRQEATQRHLRVGVLDPGGVATELGSHNKPEVRNQMIDPFLEQTEVLAGVRESWREFAAGAERG